MAVADEGAVFELRIHGVSQPGRTAFFWSIVPGVGIAEDTVHEVVLLDQLRFGEGRRCST
jgi:hypothetical protein